MLASATLLRQARLLPSLLRAPAAAAARSLVLLPLHQRPTRRLDRSVRAMATAPQLPEPTILDAVLSDHRNVSAMLARCLQAAKEGDGQLAGALATATAVDVILHSRAEEAVLYPFMVKQLGEKGEHFSEHSEKEHAELEGMLIAAVLAAREGDVPALLREMEGAQKAFEHHKHDEEDKYLPLLSQAAREGELRELTAPWAAAKRTAHLAELSGPLGGAKV